jgi:hypothetical protein
MSRSPVAERAVLEVLTLLVFLCVLGGWGEMSWHARGWVLVACGAVAAARSVVATIRLRTVLRGTATRGTVVDLEEIHFGDSGYSCHPVIAFSTDDGRAVRFTSRLSFRFHPPDKGTVLPVRYLPEAPWWAEWDRRRTWTGPLVGLALGLGLLVVGAAAYARG